MTSEEERLTRDFANAYEQMLNETGVSLLDALESYLEDTDDKWGLREQLIARYWFPRGAM